MKIALACVLLAVVAATAPPRISLELDGAAKLPHSIYRTHDLKLTQPNGATVRSRQDYAETCPANKGEAPKAYWGKKCHLPVVRAYDAGDKTIEVKARYFLVDLDGEAQSVKRVFDMKHLQSEGYKSRSTWLIKYDARDDAGNHAEQVVFALVFDDMTKPRFVYTKFTTVEAATLDYTLPVVFATDNIDPNNQVTKQMRYTIEAIPGDANKVEAPNKELPSDPFTLRKNVPVVSAKSAIDTDVVGKYIVSFKTHDSAGIYGKNSKDNGVSATEAIVVQDTTAPVIKVHGTSPYNAECTYKSYEDWGAHATDTLDTARLGRKLRISKSGSVKLGKPGKYIVNYNSADTAGNTAITKSRMVVVRDRLKPQIRLIGEPLITLRAGKKYEDKGVMVYDACPTYDGSNGQFEHYSKKALKTTAKWDSPLKINVPGNYRITWTTCEARTGGLCNKISREVVVDDQGVPEITRVGHATEYYEASRDLVYTDHGAKCHDGVEGDISHAVEVSGEVVNMKKPKCYTIRYDCQDNRGNQAKAMFRKVCVRDTTCPDITLNGPKKAYVEAGFHYKDSGATATDTLDGDISKKIRSDGNTVDTKQAFLNLKSCNDIKTQYAAAKTGEYMITIWNHKSSKVERISIWCDMLESTPQTYHLVNQEKTVKSFSFVAGYPRNTGSCPDGSAPMTDRLSKIAQRNFKNHFGAEFYLGNSGSSYTTDTYVCRFTTVHKDLHKYAKKIATMRAEVGVYHIQFYVEDKAGNDECAKTSRQVVVKDTLPPVISLKYKSNQFHKSYPTQKGVNGETNPAIAYQDKLFMAETSSVNGWVIGAIASAVAGIALLSFSAKQPSTTVPV